jgi:uncharacterized protein (TIGR02300 family)
MSPAKDLGNKYVCWKCETKFYDLHKPVPVCPKCGADQRERPAAKPARASRAAAAKAPPRGREIAAVAAEPEEESPEADDTEDDADEDEAAPDEDDE